MFYFPSHFHHHYSQVRIFFFGSYMAWNCIANVLNVSYPKRYIYISGKFSIPFLWMLYINVRLPTLLLSHFFYCVFYHTQISRLLFSHWMKSVNWICFLERVEYNVLTRSEVFYNVMAFIGLILGPNVFALALLKLLVVGSFFFISHQLYRIALEWTVSSASFFFVIWMMGK